MAILNPAVALQNPLLTQTFSEETAAQEFIYVVQFRKVGTATYRNAALAWTQAEADYILAGFVRLAAPGTWEGRIVTLDTQP